LRTSVLATCALLPDQKASKTLIRRTWPAVLPAAY